MPIILNETKWAEYIIKEGEVGNKPTSTLFLLGKYYSQVKKMNKTDIISTLNNFMNDNYKNYNHALWEDKIENLANKVHKYALKDLEFIIITKSELDTISSMDSIKYQKLLFAMLCYAKYYNYFNPKNNGWVNAEIKELYKIARVVVKHRRDKFLYLNDLNQTGLISFSNKNDNLNLKVEFIDDDSDEMLRISDFRELGYEYLNYIDTGKFIRCECCAKLVRKVTNNQRYCRECAKSQNIKYQRKRDAFKNLDSENS